MTDQYRENIDSSAEQENLESENKNEVQEFVDLESNVEKIDAQQSEIKEEVQTPELDEAPVAPQPEKEIKYTQRPTNVELMETKEIIDKLSNEMTGEMDRVELTPQEKYNKEKIKGMQEGQRLQLGEMPEILDITKGMETNIDATQKQQVETLLNIAQDQGLEKMLRVLKNVKDAEVIDLVHDLLAMSDIYKRFKE
jgi:hypothetical protein